MFPSPYGVLVFKTTLNGNLVVVSIGCFRPLTGCWSLRLYLLQSPIYIASFIDLRGKPIILVKSYHKTAQKELEVNKIAYRGKKPIFSSCYSCH